MYDFDAQWHIFFLVISQHVHTKTDTTTLCIMVGMIIFFRVAVQK